MPRGSAHPPGSWTKETAPRHGGKKGRKTRERLMREAMEAAEICAKEGLKSPLQILEEFSNDEKLGKQLRISAATAAARYRHHPMAPMPPPPPTAPTTARVTVYIPGNARDASPPADDEGEDE